MNTALIFDARVLWLGLWVAAVAAAAAAAAALDQLTEAIKPSFEQESANI